MKTTAAARLIQTRDDAGNQRFSPLAILIAAMKNQITRVTTSAKNNIKTMSRAISKRTVSYSVECARIARLVSERVLMMT
jgi:hypothetical protein